MTADFKIENLQLSNIAGFLLQAQYFFAKLKKQLRVDRQHSAFESHG